MNRQEIAGMLRAIIPAVIAYAAGRGADLSFLANPDVMAGMAALGCALWSVHAKRSNNEKADTTPPPPAA